MKGNAQPGANYVRIVYLKEMRAESPVREEEEGKVIKNSLAYLSSLIQEDNKKRIVESRRASVQGTLGEGEEERGDDGNGKKRGREGMEGGREGSWEKNGAKNQEARKLILNKIWNENGRDRMPSIEIQKPRSKTMKMQLQAFPSRQRQLQQSFIDFCNHLNHQRSPTHLPHSPPKPQPDRIIYPRSKLPTPQKPNNPPRHQNSAPKPNKLFARKSIVHRKNFKEIHNFEWGKIAQGSYDISHLKYL